MKDENGCFLTDKTATVTWNSLIGKNRYRGEAVDRLAVYEDTGLEPEEVRSQKELFDYLVFDSTPSKDIERFKRLRELAEADREGRCVVLPCKVGDRVWLTKFMWNYAKQPIPAIVCGIKTFSSSGTFTFMALTDTNNVSRSFINQDIGKTVFLTREEAEAALAKIANNCD